MGHPPGALVESYISKARCGAPGHPAHSERGELASRLRLGLVFRLGGDELLSAVDVVGGAG